MSEINYSERLRNGLEMLAKGIEVWEAIAEHEGLYEASNCGQIRSLDREVASGMIWGKPRITRFRGRILRQANTPYLSVVLSKEGIEKPREVHRLILETFVGPCPNNMEACHNDGNRKNNRLDNLRWDTRTGNFADKRKHGTNLEGQKNAMSATGRAVRIAAKQLHDAGHSDERIAEELEVTVTKVRKILQGKDLRGERKDNVFITAFGKTLTQKQWSVLSGLSVQLIYYRICVSRLSPETALTRPDSKGNYLREV